MKCWISIASLLSLCLATAVLAQERSDDIRQFDLSLASPPTPALKYRLLIDPNDRRPGNAAIFYMRAALMSTPTTDDIVDKAYDAHEQNNKAVFDKLAGQISGPDATTDILLMAAERETCDWEIGMDERGWLALLPELNYLRARANRLSVRAAYQMEQGKVDEAIGTLRLIYELGQKTGQSPVVVSGLIAAGITNLADARLSELMNRSDCPNLYWALAGLPRPVHDFRRAVQLERSILSAMVPLLIKARSQDLSPLEWRQLFNQVIDNTSNASGKNQPVAKHDFNQDLQPGGSALLILPIAQQHYAQSRKISADDVALLDSATVVGVYYFDQYQQLCEAREKLVGLPYSQLIPKMSELSAVADKMRAEAPGNPLLANSRSLDGAAESFARVDRQVAALTAVEAIRSYAAAHEGKLPEHLNEVTETPIPMNPFTDKPFEYQVQGDVAVLSSAQPARSPLEYKIHIRK
jgi:hypothetical protein